MTQIRANLANFIDDLLFTIFTTNLKNNIMVYLISISLLALVGFAFYRFYTKKSKEARTGGKGVPAEQPNPGDANKPNS
jgi:phosphotransferase system  glucose/maltose/N-acetylglucosamine-specific IIC component